MMEYSPAEALLKRASEADEDDTGLLAERSLDFCSKRRGLNTGFRSGRRLLLFVAEVEVRVCPVWHCSIMVPCS